MFHPSSKQKNAKLKQDFDLLDWPKKKKKKKLMFSNMSLKL